MKILIFPCIFLFTLIAFSQNEFDEFTATIIGDKEAFLSSKTGEFVYRAHDKTDVSNLRTNDNGVVIYTDKKIHTVKKGENLYIISKKHGLPVSEIKAINKLKTNNLKVGQAITIEIKTIVKSSSPVVSQAEGRIIARLAPGQERNGVIPPDLPPDAMPGNTINLVTNDKEAVKREVKVTQTSNTSSLDDKSFHTVKSGESLFSIAKKYKMSITDLKAINKLALNNVSVGQKLKIKLYNQAVQAPNSAVSNSSPEEAIKKEAVVKEIVETPKTNRKRVFRSSKGEAPKKEMIKEPKEVVKVAEKEVAAEVPVKPEMKDIDKDVKLKVAEENVATKEVAEDMKTMEVVKPDMSLKKLEKKEVIKDSKLKKVVKEEVAVKAPKASVKTETKPKTVKTTEKKEVSPEKEKQIEGLIKKYAKKETSETASTNVHVVKRGETLWSISRLHKLTVDELKKLNELKTNILSVGQELKVK